MSQTRPGDRKMVAVDVNEFIRTRDALSSAYISLSSAIDKSVKAYIDHTNVVLAGDATLNVSFLTQPFTQLPQQQIAQYALQHSAAAQPHEQTNALHGTSAPNGNVAGGSNGASAPNANVAVGEIGPDGKKKKRPYKQRDPNAPKRPLTAYFRFLQEQRAPLAEQMAKDPNATHKPGDLSKEATERWNKLSNDEKQPYKAAYQRALKDYDREVALYKQSGGNVDEAELKKAKELAEQEDVTQVDGAAEENVEEGAEDEEDEESSSSESSDESEEEEEEDAEGEEEMPPPPPPPPKAQKTPKSAMKKSQQADAPPTPQFSSLSTPVPASVSPERKRKAPSSEPPAEPEGSKKKRSRKSTAAEVDPKPAPTAVMTEPEPEAEIALATPTTEKKKDKKKKRKSEA